MPVTSDDTLSGNWISVRLQEVAYAEVSLSAGPVR